VAQITTNYHWEMGHRLPGHTGGCQNLHGHSYQLDVEIRGELGNDGMLIDFFEVNALIGPLLEELDHAFLVDHRDVELQAFIESQGWKCKTIPYPSTAENLCRLFSEYLVPGIKKHSNLRHLGVTIRETTDASARLDTELTGQ
jgi:6-pyruvoyltetrahydropterin/6-carboxytetrahydropterin synthase